VDQIRATGSCDLFEKEYFHKDGSRVPVLVASAGIGNPVRETVAFVLDLTERKRAEAEVRESEERFRTLVQFSFDVYWETDAQHRFIRLEFAEGLADAPAPGSDIGKTRWEVPYLEPDEEAWRKHRETLDAHLPFRDFELARPAPDGGKRYVSTSGCRRSMRRDASSATAASGGTSPNAGGPKRRSVIARSSGRPSSRTTRPCISWWMRPAPSCR
jgi:PAS domain-containing protein